MQRRLDVMATAHHLEIKNLTPSIDAYLMKLDNPANFHPDPISNDGALGFFKRGRPSQKKNRMSCD